MAKDFIDDSAYLALGIKPESIQKTPETSEIKQTLPKYNVGVTQAIKQLAESQKKTIGSKEIVDLGQSILKAVTGKITSLTQATVKEFLPIESELKQVVQLLESTKDEDNEKAFKQIDILQNKLGIDLKSFSKDLGDGIDKLFDMAEKRKTQKEEQKKIHEEKVSELVKERDILRERGINTYVDEKNMQLQIKTFNQEKIEKKQIIEKEKELQFRQKELARELKIMKKGETINIDRQERIIAQQENLTRDQLKLQERKEKAGMKPDEKAQGFISQTYGAAFDQFKLFGKEIGQMGKSLGGVVGGLANFGKGLLTSVANFARLAASMLPVIFEFIMLAMPVIAVIAGILALVAAVSWAADKLSSLNPKNWFKKKKGEESQIEGEKQDFSNEALAKGMEERGLTGTSADYSNESIAKQIESKGQPAGPNILPSVPGSTDNEQLMMPRPSILQRQVSAPRGEELNRLSSEFAVQKESVKSNNIIAPQSNNIVTNNNTTQISTLTPLNPDRSFINLNSVAI